MHGKYSLRLKKYVILVFKHCLKKHVIVGLEITFLIGPIIKNIPTWTKTIIHEKNILEDNHLYNDREEVNM